MFPMFAVRTSHVCTYLHTYVLESIPSICVTAYLPHPPPPHTVHVPSYCPHPAQLEFLLVSNYLLVQRPKAAIPQVVCPGCFLLDHCLLCSCCPLP